LCCGAFAAITQLRYVRAGKELQAFLAVEARFAEPELQAALLYVQDELAAKLAQRDYRAAIAGRGYVDPHAHPEMIACNWFNETGAMITGRFLREDVFFDSFGRLVEYYWRLLEPVVALLRRERGPHQYAAFESLARRAEHWRTRHETGAYRAGWPRLPVIDPWADIDGAGSARAAGA
jgi:hypothetical protein